jgi:hypothetical protein
MLDKIGDFMKPTIALLIMAAVLSVFFPAEKALSDEYYDFFRIMYADDLNFFHMTRVGIWNKGHYIWPLGSQDVWKEHVRNLKMLEKKYGLYVLDGAYGYYDNNAISYSLMASHKTDIKIEFDKIIRPSGPVGSKQPYRSHPRININFDGGQVAAFNLNLSGMDYEYFVDEVGVNDMNGIVVLRVCVVEDLLDKDKKYRRKCSETTLYDLSNKSIVFDNSRIISIMK